MFENITNQFDNLESKKDYWFIRTMRGKHFESFNSRGFIGINWNYITATDLKSKTEREIRQIIADNERDKNGDLYNPLLTKGRAKITSVYNKLIKFRDLKAGDMVVIPSAGSNTLVFGVIVDEEIYNDFDDSKCDLHKRRKVHWIERKNLEELDPIFYKIIFSMHAISNLNPYASYIDKIVSSVFVKEGRSHLVLQVYKKEDINYDSLNGVLQDVRKLTDLINESFHLGEDLTENSIKLNVQSPGTIEFIYNTGRSLLLASIFLIIPITVISCTDSEASTQYTSARHTNIEIIKDTIQKDDRFNEDEKASLNNFAEVHYDLIARTKQNMKEIDSIVNTN